MRVSAGATLAVPVSIGALFLLSFAPGCEEPPPRRAPASPAAPTAATLPAQAHAHAVAPGAGDPPPLDIAAIDAGRIPEAWRAELTSLPPNATEALVFIKTMLDSHAADMDQLTCHCCKKTLKQCYLDTATRAPKACSPLCAVCKGEGQDLLAALRVNMPMEEIRRGIDRKYSYGDHAIHGH